VPAQNGHELSRSDTMNSLSSGYAASAHRSVSGKVPADVAEVAGSTPSTQPRKNRVVAPPPTSYVSTPVAEMDGTSSSNRSSEQRGKMLYAYQANGDGEITVEEGDDFTVVEPDDGSGWLSVRTSHASGLVPTSYTEIVPDAPRSTATTLPDRPASTYSTNTNSSTASTHATSASNASGTVKKRGPAVAPKRGAKKLSYVEAMYDYDARSDAEWSMKEGERFLLVKPDGGDGWADVEKSGVVKSVPAAYVRDV
jgi:hypothetical protein